MFASLRHWIESIPEDGKLFRDADDEFLHSALAALLYHVIAADPQHGGKEKHEFDRIIESEFDLSQEQADHLYRSAKAATGDLHEDLQIIRAHLKDDAVLRMSFMRRLLELISRHSARAAQLELFYETLHEVFPELKTLGNHADY